MRQLRQHKVASLPQAERCIAEIAQELNTPLATISAHAEEALEVLGNSSPVLAQDKRLELEERLRIIQRQVRRLSRLAAQLLTLGKVDEAARDVRPLPAGDRS